MSVHAKQMRCDLVAGFRERIAELPDEVFEALLPEQVADLARRAVVAILAPQIWADVVGEALDTAQLVQLLGVTRQALAKRVAAGTLLGLPGKGTTFYPVWQFDLGGPQPIRVRPPAAAAFAAWVEVAGSLDPYAVASWAQTPQPELNQLTPVEYLEKHRHDDETLAFSARVTATGLAQ